MANAIRIAVSLFILVTLLCHRLPLPVILIVVSFAVSSCILMTLLCVIVCHCHEVILIVVLPLRCRYS